MCLVLVNMPVYFKEVQRNADYHPQFKQWSQYCTHWVRDVSVDWSFKSCEVLFYTNSKIAFIILANSVIM